MGKTKSYRSSNRNTSKQTLSQQIASVLIGYIRSQFIVIVIVMVCVWIFLKILDVRFPLALAVITGACSVIPTAGMILAAIIASLVAIFDSSRFLPSAHQALEGVAILLLYSALNFAVDYFLSPYMLGKLNNVHPAVSVLSVLLGTLFFGLAGTILAMPILLIIKTVIEFPSENMPNAS